MLKNLFLSFLAVFLLAGGGLAQDVWYTNETTNYRVLNAVNDVDYGRAVAAIAEKCYEKSVAKWGIRPVWATKSDIYLHSNTRSMRQSGGMPWDAPGFTQSNGPGTARVVHIQTDYADAWESVLPHEINHTFTMDRWGRVLPNWVNEGMAGQMEPSRIYETHRLAVLNNKNKLLPIKSLVTLQRYPQTNVNIFYGQSITLVKYLVSRRGEAEFVSFVDDLCSQGAELSVRRHYELTLDELQLVWTKFVETK